jgi:hypothetical protein
MQTELEGHALDRRLDGVRDILARSRAQPDVPATTRSPCEP